MGIAYNSSIVRDGLVLHLDAANTKSYPGSGTTWTDLSGNGYNATLVGTVGHSSTFGGVFSVNGSQTSDYIRFDVGALAALSSSTAWSLETILRLDTTAGTTYFHSMARTGNDNNYVLQKTNVVFPYAETNTGGGAISFSSGESLCITVVHNGASQLLYKNGVYSGTYTAANDITVTEGWVLNQEQDSVVGGFASDQATDMGVYGVRLYDKSLTAAEVRQNFESMRGRYGI
jgi:hypothetical protein